MRILPLSIAIVLTAGAAAAADDLQPRDRGAASMTLATVTWQASRASARLATGRLTITANRTQRNDGVRNSQSLILQIADFKGPGDYTVGPGSMFVGVGIDVEAATAAGHDDDAAAKAAVAMLSKAKHLSLLGAKVTITAASDSEISGTFSRPSPPGLDLPGISDGTFRALLGK
ncbi:MAG TPA: hypothetical protein VMW48_04200 [Vicinamibacterales bacterium]|nr:hypothetical protein [Vicinamibacterales bacterium]